MGERVVVGDVLAGKYRVERVLGSGGMGIVVAARHVQLDFLVALKFMSDEALADPELVSRFLREARAAARLRSEHVARVTDVGTLESGAPYQVIEYLEGSDLAAVLSSEGAQPISRAVEFVIHACEALDEAHHAGIVHRDVKPSNLFLTKRPNGTACVKVLDFGISKSDRLGGSSAKLHATHSRAILGSPFYMAPEQIRSSREVDTRADIWALGATLYELLTGRVPFQADSLLELVMNVAQADPAPIRKIRPEVPWALEQVVLRCLEKDRDDRFATVRTLSAALAPFLQRKQDVLQGGVAMTEWRAATVLESIGDTVTRVVDAPTGPNAIAPSALPRGEPSPARHTRESADASEGSAPTPSSSTTLAMPGVAQGSVPPVAQGALRGWRTGARVSWGRSQNLLGKTARAAWGVAIVGALATCGAAAAFIFRSHERPATEPDVTPVSATLSALLPMPTTNSTGMEGSVAASAPSGSAAPVKSTQIPTWSVADLPMATQPALLPPSPRPLQPSIAFSVRLQASAQPLAQPPAQASAQRSAPTSAPATPVPPSRASDPLANPN